MKIMLTTLIQFEGHRNFQGDLVARAIERKFPGIRATCSRVPDMAGHSQIQVSSDKVIRGHDFAAMQYFGMGYLAAVRDADAGMILSAN